MVQITTPTLVVDKAKCVAKIKKMMSKAKEAGVRHRPHCKTHACLEIASWMREYGVTGITVSSISMAQYFAKEWKDITVAFPVNILEVDTINTILSDGEPMQLNLLVENVEAVQALDQQLQHAVGIFIKIDVGYGRTGIPPRDAHTRIDPILKVIQTSQCLTFLGFLSHAGQSYDCRSQDELMRVYNESKNLLIPLKERYIGKFPNLQLSYGDSPTCSVVSAGDIKGQFDEIRPGNYVFYDLEQATIGSCQWEDISVAVACPIVSKHVDRREIVMYGGGVHISKEQLDGEPEGKIYGRVVESKKDSLEWGKVIDGMYVRSLTQEHGVVVVPDHVDMEQFEIGQLLFILPVHSCMSADCMKYKGYLTTEGKWLDRMKN